MRGWKWVAAAAIAVGSTGCVTDDPKVEETAGCEDATMGGHAVCGEHPVEDATLDAGAADTAIAEEDAFIGEDDDAAVPEPDDRRCRIGWHIERDGVALHEAEDTWSAWTTGDGVSIETAAIPAESFRGGSVVRMVLECHDGPEVRIGWKIVVPDEEGRSVPIDHINPEDWSPFTGDPNAQVRSGPVAADFFEADTSRIQVCVERRNGFLLCSPSWHIVAADGSVLHPIDHSRGGRTPIPETNDATGDQFAVGNMVQLSFRCER